MKSIFDERWRKYLKNDEAQFWGSKNLHLREGHHWRNRDHVWGEKKTTFYERWKPYLRKCEDHMYRKMKNLSEELWPPGAYNEGNAGLYVANAEVHEHKCWRSYCHRFCNVHGLFTPGDSAGSWAVWNRWWSSSKSWKGSWNLICCHK